MQYIASYTALGQFNATGVWSVAVINTAAITQSMTVWINGQQVAINATTQIGVFTVNASGDRGMGCMFA